MLPKPARQMIVVESQFYTSPTALSVGSMCNYGQLPVRGFFHGETRMNVLFGDGHVKNLTIGEFSQDMMDDPLAP